MGTSSPLSTSRIAQLAHVLRGEAAGGVLLLLATVAALAWANSPFASSYDALMDTRIGPSALHLDLTLSQWAADGLLAVFFFVVGLELKREFVVGDLRDPRRAALPLAAAVGGMAVPALVFVAVNLGTGDGALQGWAIPTATDIAFAVAVLAVVGTHLPPALRTFLLTLAVVDDLLAVTIIGIFYTDDIDLAALGLAMLPLAAFTWAVQKGVRAWWVLLPLAVAVWASVHESGVHATVAGVLLGFAVPVVRRGAKGTRESGPGPAEEFEHRIRPLSAGIAVPIFAFCAAGVTVGGLAGLTSALRDPIALGIVVGLVVGKTVGIFGTTFLLSKCTRATLDSSIKWADLVGMSMLAGIGFTVSLLIGELAFGPGERDDHVKIAVLCGSAIAAVSASLLLGMRNRAYRHIRNSAGHE